VDSIDRILGMFADFWTAVAAIAQCLTVGVAGWALLYARGQVDEARRTRERVAQPDVVVYIDHNPKNWQYMDLVVKNFGQTPAYNIRLTLPRLGVIPYTSGVTGELITELYVPQRIAVLAPGQEWRTFWFSAVQVEDYKGELTSQYVGHVEFDDEMNPDKKPFQNLISLDTKIFRNMLKPREDDPAKKIAEHIAEVAKILQSYHDDESGIWVYTLSGDQERQRREQEKAKEKAEFDTTRAEIERALHRNTETEG
jgi:hypothetical protein